MHHTSACFPVRWYGVRKSAGSRAGKGGVLSQRLRRCFLAQIGIRHARQIQQHLRQCHGFALHQPVVQLARAAKKTGLQITQMQAGRQESSTSPRHGNVSRTCIHNLLQAIDFNIIFPIEDVNVCPAKNIRWAILHELAPCRILLSI